MAEKTSWSSSQNSIRDWLIISQPLRYPKSLPSRSLHDRILPLKFELPKIAARSHLGDQMNVDGF
jgi:hypothetical protein